MKKYEKAIRRWKRLGDSYLDGCALCIGRDPNKSPYNFENYAILMPDKYFYCTGGFLGDKNVVRPIDGYYMSLDGELKEDL